ncbi:DnaJ domain-containing protein [Planctomyces sp. SH-PL62]|uniref:DnaJ domain-containing protein n=1 Tax=Planctomyces sp. SH-PL62 TaxID=1636152 RepID=UPI00078E73F1|nr:DnaJ domain-containing protein [Planctomyces sp. SH-PL62]AMV37821.1 Chaperone protein DnaJ [Planctomyces sp. SH-PL62]
MLLMAEEQDERVIWVVVELHRPKGRIRSRIVLHLGEYRNRDEAEAAFLERLQTNPALRAVAERWAAHAEDVLSDRKARARFLLCGALTGGIAAYADEMLRRRDREAEQARMRARAALWSPGGPSAAFSTLGLFSAASLDEIKAAYRRKAVQLHPDRGGDHAAMVQLNAAYEAAVEYAAWRG